MAENIFATVRQSIQVREAAELYGIEVSRNGMACCPFHDDHNPSMKVNEDYFYCFGCGATGDVIDFTARLYDLSPREAAEKLAQDVGLNHDRQTSPGKKNVRQKTEEQKFREARDHSVRVLTDYYQLLQRWERDYPPKTPEERLHPRFTEAIQKKSYVGYLLDTFQEYSKEEQKLWIDEHQPEIAAMERSVEIMADKPTSREKLQEITAGIEQNIKDLFESEKYAHYLSVMSKFHRYSVNNTMLIYMQRPDATLVAGYNKWKNQFERHVKKGEHGITIIAPTPYKKKVEEMKRDPDTHAPILDADGKAIMEEKEIEIPMFRPVKVFDVSQTDGKPLPELASKLSGTVPHYEVFLEALRRSASVPIEFEALTANLDGYFSSDQQRIAIREGMSEVQTISAAVHEVAHSKLHDPKKYEAEPAWKIVMVSEGGTKKDYRLDFATEAEAEQAAAEDGWRYVDENQFEWRLEVEEDQTAVKQAAKNRNTEEVEAESISYAVCQYFGIQTSENSFGYIASWSEGKELKELRASLETINKTSCELIDNIERHYKEICKERDIDLTAAPKQERDPIEVLAEDIDQFTFDYDPYEYHDNVDDREDALKELTVTLRRSDAGGVRSWLQNIINEDDPGETTEKAAQLLDRLNQLVPETKAEQISHDDQNTPPGAARADPMAAQFPGAKEQVLDEYPMPDPALSEEELAKCSCLDSDLLPLSKERANELMERDLTVYIIQDGEKPEMAFDVAELDAHDGIFALSRDEWEKTSEFHGRVQDRMNHQEERERAFLDHGGDCFAIYQLKQTDDLRDIRYEGLERLKASGQEVQHSNYDLVYTAPLTSPGSTPEQLDRLYKQFNLEKPPDFHSPSMSVSDIVAIRQGGRLSCYYCDSIGFEQIPGFLPGNPLKNAEMSVEDDYGMIDGIINNGLIDGIINNGLKEPQEHEKKKSVREQLQAKPRTKHKKTAPKKSAEREM